MTDSKLTLAGEGQIRVSSVTQVINYDDVKVWEIDLHSKYPDVWISTSYDSDGTHYLVHLAVAKETIKVDTSKEGGTTFEFITPPGENWRVTAGGGRYTVEVFAYRYAPWKEETDAREEG